MLWSFGDDSLGQLGVHEDALSSSSQGRHPAPQRVLADSFQAEICLVTAGEAHSLAVDSLGGVYLWGRSREGQCGIREAIVRTPRPLTSLLHEHVVAAAVSSDASFAITASGALYQWGAVHTSSTALAHAHLAGYGRSMDSLSASEERMLRASLVTYLSAGIDEDESDGGGGGSGDGGGDSAGGGRDGSGISGGASGGGGGSGGSGGGSDGSGGSGGSSGGGGGGGDDGGGDDCGGAAGGGSSEYRTHDGTKVTVGTKRELRPEPARVALPAGERATGVAGGFGFAIVLVSGGGALAFGLNDRFQCGVGDRMTRDTPTRIPGPIGSLRLRRVACGQQHTAVIDEHGGCWSWGLGSFGQLGHGRKRDEPRPRKISALAQLGAASAVACGQQHTIFLLRAPPAPTAAATPAAAQTAAAAAAASGVGGGGDMGGGGGVDGDCVGSAGGDVLLLGAGHAEFGQLGTGDSGAIGEASRDFPLPRTIPLPADLLGTPSDVRCGALHSVVLTSLGEVLTFGWGASGALGHGGFSYELDARPVEELALRRVGAIAAGGRHTLALADGDGQGIARLQRDLSAMLRGAFEADCAIDAGKPPAGRRRFLAHRAILACRCPRLLAMLAFSSRFGAPLPEGRGHAPPPFHWPSHSSAAVAAEPSAAEDALPLLALPTIRAPIFALLLTWVYTGVVETAETLLVSKPPPPSQQRNACERHAGR